MATILRHFHIPSGPCSDVTRQSDWKEFEQFLVNTQKQLGCYGLAILKDGAYGLFLHDQAYEDQDRFDRVDQEMFVKTYSYTTYLGLSFRLHKVRALTKKNSSVIRPLLENMRRFSSYFAYYHEFLLALNNDKQQTQVQFLVKYNQVLPIVSMRDTLRSGTLVPQFECVDGWQEIPVSVLDKALYETHDAPFDLSIDEWMGSCIRDQEPDWCLMTVIANCIERYGQMKSNGVTKSMLLREHNKIATFIDLAKRARLPVNELLEKTGWK
jgi:hypothetical protein